jgi:hypothetical protein
MEQFRLEAIDVDRPRLFGRYNPQFIRGRTYLYRGPRGPVDINVRNEGAAMSLRGPEMGSVVVPFGPSGRLHGDTVHRPPRPSVFPLPWSTPGCDEEDDPLGDGVVVTIGNDDVTFSLPRTRVIPVVQVTAGWATWSARRTSALLLRWTMVDGKSRRPVVRARAWRGKVEDSPSVCEVGAMIIIWAALLDDLFAGGDPSAGGGGG